MFLCPEYHGSYALSFNSIYSLQEEIGKQRGREDGKVVVSRIGFT